MRSYSLYPDTALFRSGLADVERQELVQPDAPFRGASFAKSITAVAILTRVDAGALTLADRAFPLLRFAPAANATRDPRLDEITVDQLLVDRKSTRLNSSH